MLGCSSERMGCADTLLERVPDNVQEPLGHIARYMNILSNRDLDQNRACISVRFSWSMLTLSIALACKITPKCLFHNSQNVGSNNRSDLPRLN